MLTSYQISHFIPVELCRAANDATAMSVNNASPFWHPNQFFWGVNKYLYLCYINFSVNNTAYLKALKSDFKFLPEPISNSCGMGLGQNSLNKDFYRCRLYMFLQKIFMMIIEVF